MQKTIGLIGGMSWESTQIYYQIINREINRRLGDVHSASCIVYSFDFQRIMQLQHQDRWEELGRILSDSAQKLAAAGASFLVLCTNTMHILSAEIEQNTNIPLLHITDATAIEIQKAGIYRVGLLGTKFTMEQDFYKTRMKEKFGIEVIIPEAEERTYIHKTIYEELVKGEIHAQSRDRFIQITEHLKRTGAAAVILGCTEIPLLLNQAQTTLPLYDTTKIHALAAVDMALKTNP
jgi:aspartate racemase